MTKWSWDWEVICHWCGKGYKSKKGRLQARFCSPVCKQAHYRAYKKYVTAKHLAETREKAGRVTRKKRKCS